MSNNTTPPEQASADPSKEKAVRIGSFIALLFAMVFFSGAMGKVTWFDWTWWKVLDFTTLNGAFGQVAANVTAGADGALQVAKTTYKGVGGRGAMEGFLFAFGLIPAVMFALAMINVLEHYGALDAARKLLTPILRPLLGVPGSCALAMIGSLQSTDVGASLTRRLSDENQLTENQRDVFIMFQFSAGAMITNFFSSGAVLFTFMMVDGKTPVVPVSMGFCIVVMFVMKLFGANLLRIIFGMTSKKDSSTNAA
jgi:nucleoside recognition membrane protein YjiH